MKKNLFLIAVATVVVAACSSDLDDASVVESCPVRLCSDGLTGMTRAGQSVQLTQFVSGQQMGVFLVENGSGANVTTYPQPLTYTVDGSALTTTAMQYWPTDGNGLNIYGVYPATAATACNVSTNFTVRTNQTTDANYMASDLMTGVPSTGNPAARTASAIALKFTHLLTKIDINVSLSANSGFTASDLASAPVAILGTKPTATFNIQASTVSAADVATTTITAGTGANNSAIIVPQTVAANTSFIQVTIGGGNYIYKLPTATTFAPSMKYTYNLTVTKTGLTLSGTTITPWNAAIASNGDAESQGPPVADLSTLTSNYTAKDGEILTGTLGSNVKISIADGATVILHNVTINGMNNNSYKWAGINCLGDATIKLAAGTTNTVKGFYENYPGIHVPVGSTLTIKGTGTLNASSNGYGAGIGGGRQLLSCGNIVIEGGDITATGGNRSGGGAGIGSSYQTSCGTITISGGTVNATGGDASAGIGSGYAESGSSSSSCGAITISGGTVNATGGYFGAGIGSGFDNSSCDDITISGGTVNATGGNCGAGIGGGDMSSCGDITISGGSVTTTGNEGGAGIGSGTRKTTSCGTITISGGTVIAKGSGSGAGIGCGLSNSSCKAITILDTVTKVTAEKGSSATYSIGTGRGGSSDTVTIGGITYWQNNAAVNGGDTYLATSPLVYQPQ